MSISPDTERRIRGQVRTLVERNPDRALVRAIEVHDEAIKNKQESKKFQAKTRISMITFAAFKEALEEMGIEVIIEPTLKNKTPKPGGSSATSEDPTTS